MHRRSSSGETTRCGAIRARFKRGTVALRVDDEWERELSVKDRRLVTALTFPLMKHYGYSLR